MKKIVFISRLDNKAQLQWLSCLRQQLPEETILLPEHMSEDEFQHVDIAIVADPDPSVIAKFPNLVWIQSLWAGVEKLMSEKSLQHIKIVRLVDPELAKTMAEAVIAWTFIYIETCRNMLNNKVKKMATITLHTSEKYQGWGIRCR